jgi:site-specific DNA recombinase
LTGGLLRCGRCRAAMVARPNERRQRRYACAKVFGGCEKTFNLAEPLEDYVRDAVFLRLAGPALDVVRAEVSESPPEDGLGAELAAFEVRRRESAAAYAEGALSLEAFRHADRDLQGRIDRVRAQIGQRDRRAFAGALPPSTKALPSWWEDATPEQRRQLVGLVVEAVTLEPAVPGRNRFDPERVSITWRA